MSERHPDDATLLALDVDPATGVEYIPTGLSPYHLAFRRMLYRLLRAGERANDLRVYANDGLSLGVRGGRCIIAGNVVAFTGQASIAVAANATLYLWLDAAGDVQSGSALPGDRTSFLPLALVTTDEAGITDITDLRGEAFLQSPSIALLGLTATADEINQAIAGISADVSAANLSQLCAGPSTPADALHRHEQVFQHVAGEARFTLFNDSDDAAANIALRLSLPNVLPHSSFLLVDRAHGFLQQRYDNTAYNLVGCVHAAHRHEGALGASQAGKLIGAVPVAGVISDVILSIGNNMQSDVAGDGIAATVYANDTAIATSDPAMTSQAGAGFRCTDQGDGTAAQIKTDGSEVVARGDLLTVDLTRTAAGNISNEASDIAVLIVIRAARPE